MIQIIMTWSLSSGVQQQGGFSASTWGAVSIRLIPLPLLLAVLTGQLRWHMGILPVASQSLNSTPPSRKASTGTVGQARRPACEQGKRANGRGSEPETISLAFLDPGSRVHHKYSGAPQKWSWFTMLPSGLEVIFEVWGRRNLGISGSKTGGPNWEALISFWALPGPPLRLPVLSCLCTAALQG